MTFIYITEEKLNALQSFTSIKEMDQAIREHRKNNHLSQTEKEVLFTLSQYSVKYIGVSYLRKNNIAAAVGKSRRTIIRVCNRLEELGVIKQYQTKRITGDRRQSVNIIVIQPLQRPKKEDVTTEVAQPKTPTQAKNINNTYKDTGSQEKCTPPSINEIIKKGLAHALPEKIFTALAPFFNGKELYDIYGVLLRAKAKVNPTLRIEEHHEDYVGAFYNVVRLYKKGKVKNLRSFLYTSWENVSTEIDRRLNWQKSAFFTMFRDVMEEEYKKAK